MTKMKVNIRIIVRIILLDKNDFIKLDSGKEIGEVNTLGGLLC
ncbi:MAG TPA: hypothetical protein VFD57_04030 [Clostridia bacterium]|nr:hypothetical protein [Clostridia bacterium]